MFLSFRFGGTAKSFEATIDCKQRHNVPAHWVLVALVVALENLVLTDIKSELPITVSTIDVFNGVSIDQCIN